MDNESAATFERHLRELGLELDTVQPLVNLEEDAPLDAQLLHRRGVDAVTVFYSHRVTPGVVAHAVQMRNPLMLADRIGPAAADAMRNAQVNFLDVAGNIHLELQSLLIDIRGRRVPAAAYRSQSSSRPTNLFSMKRSQVIMALLAWPYLRKASVRALADASGVSHGQAYETLGAMETSGFFDLESRTLLQGGLLLDSWAAAYPSGLGASRRFETFRGELSHPLKAPEAIFISGARAMDGYLRGVDQLTVYTNGDPGRLAYANRWTTSGVRNVQVGRTFWEVPSAENRFDIAIAPSPIVYADLLASGEPRQREAAQELRSTDNELRRL